MIGGSSAFFKNLHKSAAVGGGMSEHIVKMLCVKKMRAGAGYEYSAGIEDTHSAKIYFFVAAVSLLQSFCAF